MFQQAGIVFFTSILFSINLWAAKASMFPNILLSSDISVSAVAQFIQVGGKADSIDRLRIYFLRSRDCQTGYINQYETPGGFFDISSQSPFVLTEEGVIQAARTTIREETIASVGSILVLFLGRNKETSDFLGSCRDQGINCCIPIECSLSSRACVPTYGVQQQEFSLG